MSPLLTLALLWLYSDRQKLRPPAQPAWPTPASPPPPPQPPIPAFQSQMPPADANTATPLPQLHDAPPEPVHADATTPAHAATAAAKHAAKHAASKVLHSVHVPNPFGHKKKKALKTAAVHDLQSILISRGAALSADGKYGPRTASAWASLAKGKGLDATIQRVNPTVAQVASHTYDVLSVPAIP